MRRLPFVAFALLSAGSAAHADTIANFSASGTFVDGSTLSGQIAIDTTAGTVKAVDLMTSGASSFAFGSIASQSATRFPSEYFIGVRNPAATEDLNFTLPDGSSTNPLVGYTGGSICSASLNCAAGSNLYNLVTNSGGSGLVSGTLTPIPSSTITASIIVEQQTTVDHEATARIDGLFSTTLGTLNSIGINLSGIAHDQTTYPDLIQGGLTDTPSGFRTTYLFQANPTGRGALTGTFPYSFTRSNTNAGTFRDFETGDPNGVGDLALQFSFLDDTALDRAVGTISYNYTPFLPSVGSSGPSTEVPEPTSFVLLGSGLLGALGVARKRATKNVSPLA